MTTQRRSFLLAAATSALLLGAAPSHAFSISIGSGDRVNGSGEMASEVRGLSGFDAVSLQGEYKVVVRQAAAERVEVKTDKNLMPYIETRVVESGKGRVLEVSTKRGYRLQSNKMPELLIDATLLRALSVAGAGVIKAEGLKSPELVVSVAGSGDVMLREVRVEQMTLKVTGSGDIHAQGQADKLQVSVAGSGDIRARELTADDVRVRIAGSGDVAVHAARKLDVSIAGSGDVVYSGAPDVKSSIAGSGRVSRAP